MLTVSGSVCVKLNRQPRMPLFYSEKSLMESAWLICMMWLVISSWWWTRWFVIEVFTNFISFIDWLCCSEKKIKNLLQRVNFRHICNFCLCVQIHVLCCLSDEGRSIKIRLRDEVVLDVILKTLCSCLRCCGQIMLVLISVIWSQWSVIPY